MPELGKGKAGKPTTLHKTVQFVQVPTKRGSVKFPDHSVNVLGSRSWLAHVFQKASFISGGMSGNRQMEGPEEAVRYLEILSS